MAIVVDQNVLRLQVPVDYSILMQLLHGEHYLSEVEARILLRHEYGFANLSDELASRKVLQNHVEVLLVLQSLMDATAKVVGLPHLQNILLVLDVLHLLFALDCLL